VDALVWRLGYGLDDGKIYVRFPEGTDIYVSSIMSKHAMGPNQCPFQWVEVARSPREKQPGLESISEIKNAWSRKNLPTGKAK
jgi:hypothetical protein